LYSRTIYNSKQSCWYTKKFKNFTSGEGRNQAAIVVTKKELEILLIKELSDEDMVVLEVIIDHVEIMLVSMYFDINQQILIVLLKFEAIIHNGKGAGFLIAMDSNSKSTSWHETLTNTRGRIPNAPTVARNERGYRLYYFSGVVQVAAI
jgi:hypothetical protein